MKAWLYDTLIASEDLQGQLEGVDGDIAGRVVPRGSQDTVNLPKPFLIYMLGNNTNEDLAEDQDHVAHRQFFEVQIHDEGADYTRINDLIDIVKAALVNAKGPAVNVTTVRWLETSAEFNNETYNTIFRYVRFQAIISKGERAA